MPLTGLGTYKLKDKDLIKDAILLGYKLIDTAELYRTEEIVVSAIKECKKGRDGIKGKNCKLIMILNHNFYLEDKRSGEMFELKVTGSV